MTELVYVPNPPHKATTTEAGPPRWIPYKEKCDPAISLAQAQQMLRDSFSEDGSPTNPRRYAVRRSGNRAEFYESKLTQVPPGGHIEVHGHPTRRVPPAVLRRMRDSGAITRAEFERFRKELT